MTCIVTFIALALFISTTASALYGEASDVVTLTTDNFEASVLNSDAIWLIHFYAAWSGHCKALAPRFTQAAHALKGSVHFGAVDGILHVKLSEEYNVQSYSTLMYFGHNKSLPIRYEGERSSKDFVKGALALTLTDALDRLDVTLTDPRTNNLFGGTAVVELHDGTFFETLMDHRNDKGWSVLFYSPHSRNSLELVSTWIAAASELNGTTLFGAIDATMSRRVTRRFNIYDYPTVISFAPGLQQPEVYRGSLSKDDVVRAAMVKADEISFHALKQHTYLAACAGVTLLQKSLLKSVGSLVNSALPVVVAVVCWFFVAGLWTRPRPQR